MATFKGHYSRLTQKRGERLLHIKSSCAKIILQIGPFGQAHPVYAVSHVVIKNIVLEYTETTFYSLPDG